MYDPQCENFVLGSGGSISTWDKEKNKKTPLIIRGLSKNSQLALKSCIENNRTYYYIDTGYIQPNVKKDYHRIVKNNLQNLNAIVDRPHDRLRKLNWNYRNVTNRGKKILVCPPSEKVMKFYGMNLDAWLEETVATIKSKTTREIEIRLKPLRNVRVTTDTIWKKLEETFCLVTFNSIAASEAILYSVPAIALAPNAASVICNTSLDDIRKPYLPTKEETIRFAAHLSYCQFTEDDMRNGFAWKTVNEMS